MLGSTVARELFEPQALPLSPDIPKALMVMMKTSLLCFSVLGAYAMGIVTSISWVPGPQN